MNFDCPRCGCIIVGTNLCPRCNVYSSTPSQSTVTIEEITDDNDGQAMDSGSMDDRKGKRKRGSTPPPRERDSKVLHLEPVPRNRADRASPTSYALAFTLGRCHLDPFGGDGAYSNWMNRYFSAHLDPQGCVHVDRLHYEGNVGNATNSNVSRELNPVIRSEFQRFLQNDRLHQTTTIILNWHVRFTGTPNGYTGRGVNPTLIQSLQELARQAGKNLVVIYTVHEYTQLDGKLPSPGALVALNPDVYGSLGQDFAQLPSVRSRVPGLMTSLHTSSVDLILRFVGELPSQEGLAVLNLSGGYLLQQLKLLNGYSQDALLRTTPGIVLFGMITQRHGTTVANVNSLCQFLSGAGFPNTFKVIVAGKPQEPKLVDSLRDLAASTPRLLVHGLLGSFDDLVGCRYAISFDEMGFRHNASAMVNVTRAGHLLFSRRGGESDHELIARAVRVIGLCERNPAFYQEMLIAQQTRFRCTEPLRVGHHLDLFFRQIAGGASSVEK
jgi:hypothetical protein